MMSRKLSPWNRVFFFFFEKLNSLVQQIPYIVWKLTIHYQVHRGLPFVPVPSPINPVHTLPTDFFFLFL